MTLKSEIGTKAAWNGFSTQTLYIAYRLIKLNEKDDMYPENVEDLMIKQNNEVKELVQVKNLSSDLSLSDLNPQNEDSFFNRVLRYKEKDIIIKVVSFGNIGSELEGLIRKNEKDIKNISDKLKKYNFKKDEIEWILKKLEIEKVDEKELKELIIEEIKKDYITGIAPNIIFNHLICYIASLSRFKQKTNFNLWNKKVHNIIKDIRSIKGMYAQYGKTIININDYKSSKTLEELKKEYYEGVDASPAHIRNGLDLKREKWLKKIENGFEKNNIVIIKGESGQGKSSLAYRYLLDNYIEDNIFIINHVIDEKQAEDIVMAINGLSSNKTDEIIVYIDIVPYDKNWKWIIDQICLRDYNIKVLLTIREEDYKRSNLEKYRFGDSIIELELDVEEAKQIFEKYNSQKFLNFDEAWKRFGEKGPLMEFIYLLNENETLEEKLTTQINNIIDNEEDSDNWIKFLLIVSYAGKENLRISLNQIVKTVNSSNISKMMKNMQKEYLIRITEETNTIVTTHAVRAKLLEKIIKLQCCYNDEDLLIDCLKCTKDFSQVLLVEYFYNHFSSNLESLVKKLSKENFDRWISFASIIASLLWLDTFSLYNNCKEDIDIGNEICNDSFVTLIVGDITGYINDDRNERIETFGRINPNILKVKDKIDLNRFIIKYFFTDLYLKNIVSKIDNKNVEDDDNLSDVGYVLFWLGKRNLFIKSISCIEINNIENNVLDFLVGLQVQNLSELYNNLLKKLKDRIIEKYNIIQFYETVDEVWVKFTFNIKDNSEKSSNDRVMEVVNALRRIYWSKKIYHVKMIGTNIIKDFKLPDTEKNIKSEKLLLLWVTSINRYLIEIDEFDKRRNTWKEYKQSVDSINDLILEFLKKYNAALDYLYSTGRNVNKLCSSSIMQIHEEIIKQSKNMDKMPKSTTNKYGLKFNEDNKIEVASNNDTNKMENNIFFQIFNKYVNSFINFLNQKDETIINLIKGNKEFNYQRSKYIIFKSLKDFTLFTNEYSNLYGKNKIQEDLYKELCILLLFWEEMIKNGIRKEKGKLYDIVEKDKKKHKDMEEFIYENIYKYQVDEIKDLIGIEITEIDNYFNELYSKYKIYFSESNYFSYDEILLGEFQDKVLKHIKIVPLYQKSLYKEYIKPNFMKLIYSKNNEDFINTVLINGSYPIDEIQQTKFMGDDSLIYNCLKITGVIQRLKLLYSYIISVNSEIDPNNIVVQTYNNWKKETNKIHEESLDEIISLISKLFLENDEEIYIKIGKNLIGNLNNIKKVSYEMMGLKEEKDVEYLDYLNDIIVSYIDGICQ